MGTVQILLFAEVMGRSSTFSDVVRPAAGVCRKLFASDATGDRRDPALVAREMECRLRKEINERWNFDFERETPLPGRYQWVPVGVPQRSVNPTVIEASAAERPKIVAELLKPQRTSVKATPHGKSKKSNAGVTSANQYKITDFMPRKKRHQTEDVVTSPHKLKLRRLNNTNLTATNTTRPR